MRAGSVDLMERRHWDSMGTQMGTNAEAGAEEADYFEGFRFTDPWSYAVATRVLGASPHTQHGIQPAVRLVHDDLRHGREALQPCHTRVRDHVPLRRVGRPEAGDHGRLDGALAACEESQPISEQLRSGTPPPSLLSIRPESSSPNSPSRQIIGCPDRFKAKTQRIA